METNEGASTSSRADFWGEASSFNISALDLDNISNLEVSALCCDEDYLGFDRNSGSTWIYPTNYPMRDYQFNIVKASLFKNTLVSLPTGLGKTFIAAVVMYNFYRWYPMGKIIFVAPTRPLVAQQIEACYKIMAIPPNDTIEMTGTLKTTIRKAAWLEKRIIFATPQVVHNDLESGACPGELVRCLVIDEAHRARGRHSYCQLIESLFLRDHKLFRVLALSATPGSKVDDVINVVRNLKIAHLELRTEECLDVAMYSHSRKIQTIVVEFGAELSQIMRQFMEILNIYSRRLVQYKVLNGNLGGLSKGRIIMLYKEYQTREKSSRHPQHKFIMLDFTMIITLYHALELLTKHGARVFLNFFDEHTDKAWVGKDDRLTSFLERLRDDLGPNPMSLDISTLPDGSVPEIKGDFKFGHPKFDHLKKIMMEHFDGANSRGQETKAIVFCEYRESVNLVHRLLLQCRPLIKPQMFVGQGLAGTTANGQNIKAFSQKQQLRVMKSFREGLCNVLVSTCVGEEGLDVGSVDLIVCFDISNKSPIRLVQRCGRTGRERGGRVVILVTEGREHQTLKDCMYQRDNLNKKVLQSKDLQKCLFQDNPRLLPSHVKPECCKMFITVKKLEENESNKKGQRKVSDLLRKPKNGLRGQSELELISEEEYHRLFSSKPPSDDYFPESKEMWNMSKEDLTNFHEDKLDKLSTSKWLEWQRNPQSTFKIAHSSDSNDLCALLQFADSKRFNVPSTCSTDNAELPANAMDVNIELPSNNRPLKKCSPTKRKVKSSKNNVAGKIFDIREMFTKIDRFNNKEQWLLTDKYNEILKDCGIDPNNIGGYLKQENISMTLVDLMVENEVTRTKEVKKTSKYSIPVVRKFKKPNAKKVNVKNLKVPSISLIDEISSNILNDNNDRDIEISLDYHLTYPERPVNNVGSDIQDNQCIDEEKEENKDTETKSNWDMIDVDTIFDDDGSVHSETSKKSFKETTENTSDKNPLQFFGLESIDDIFDDTSFEEALAQLPEAKNLTDSESNTDEGNCSPILCTQRRKSKNNSSQGASKANDCDYPNNNDTSLLSITQMVNFIIDSNETSPAKVEKVADEDISKLKNKDYINWDIFDDDENNSDESSHSIILATQKPIERKSQIITEEKVIIPESSDSSSDEFSEEIVGSKFNPEIEAISKRKLESDGEDSSPFFAKISRVESPSILSSARGSLNQKLQQSLSCIDSQKENVHPKSNNEIKSSPNFTKPSVVFNSFDDVSQLSIFERRSSFESRRNNSHISKNTSLESDTDGSDAFVKNSKPHRKRKRTKMKKTRPACEFIDYEAILSEDSYQTSSGNSDTEGSSKENDSFICDEHAEADDVDMHAKYLESVKDSGPGVFKIPALLKPITKEIFSQILPEQDASYELDSFCVDNDINLTQHHEMSELEMAEAILKKRKRRKFNAKKIKQKESEESEDSPVRILKKKRTRLRIDSQSSSSSDSGTDFR